MTKRKLSTTLVLALALTFVVLPQLALAGVYGGTGALPWEGALTILSNSLTGPVATSIALIAIFSAGAVLIWGGEINRFASMAVYIVLVIGLLVMAQNILNALYTPGVIIPQNLITQSITPESLDG